MLYCPFCFKNLEFVPPEPGSSNLGDMFKCSTIHHYPDTFSVFFNKKNRILSVIHISYKSNGLIYDITSGINSTSIVVAECVIGLGNLEIRDYAHLDMNYFTWAWYDLSNLREQISTTLTFS